MYLIMCSLFLRSQVIDFSDNIIFLHLKMKNITVQLTSSLIGLYSTKQVNLCVNFNVRKATISKLVHLEVSCTLILLRMK